MNLTTGESEMEAGSGNNVAVKAILLGAALLSFGAAIYLGADLYAGLFESGFSLVRGKPITAADGFRYQMAILGESLGVLLMLGCTGLMFALLRRLGA